jgi:hypothetical protein
MWLMVRIIGIVATALGVRLVNAILDAFGLDPMRWLVALLMEVPTEGWIEVASPDYSQCAMKRSVSVD